MLKKIANALDDHLGRQARNAALVGGAGVLGLGALGYGAWKTRKRWKPLLGLGQDKEGGVFGAIAGLPAIGSHATDLYGAVQEAVATRQMPQGLGRLIGQTKGMWDGARAALGQGGWEARVKSILNTGEHGAAMGQGFDVLRQAVKSPPKPPAFNEGAWYNRKRASAEPVVGHWLIGNGAAGLTNWLDRHRREKVAALKKAEKIAASAKLKRHFRSLRKKDLPVSAPLRNEVARKANDSARRLQDMYQQSDPEDLAAAGLLPGAGGRKGVRGLINSVKAIKPLRRFWETSAAHEKRLSSHLADLEAHGSLLANVRKTIPRTAWASDDEIKAVKSYGKQLRKEEKLDPKLYPLNIHRRLFGAKGRQSGDWGARLYPLLRALDGVNRRTGAVAPGRSNSFLYPLKQDDPLAANNTLWHEAIGHGFDPRFRSFLSSVIPPSKASTESFATIVGAYGINRDPAMAADPAVQRQLDAHYKAYPQGWHGAPKLPYQTPTSLVPSTDKIFQGARQTHNAIYSQAGLFGLLRRWLARK